jgi:hypothetical protein
VLAQKEQNIKQKRKITTIKKEQKTKQKNLQKKNRNKK